MEVSLEVIIDCDIRILDMKETNTITYRSHIDGLRGIAVIAVVLYHARTFGLDGGYVGVDIFFVISGFLITAIILRELKTGTFSLLEFWERRVRRIVPALFLMMVASIIAAHLLILYPLDYKHFGNAVIAQSLFVSNMFFMLTDNYFDQPSQYSPLLHTWTLSVEEQFYIIFPLIILLPLWLWKIARSRGVRILKGFEWSRERILLMSVSVLSICSFLLNLLLVNIHPESTLKIPFMSQDIYENATFRGAGFYLLFTRAWELGLGAIIAIAGLKIRSKILAEFAGFAGLFVIGVAVYFFDDKTPFPGFAALLPTLGAVAFIIANEETKRVSGKILSSPFLVWIGLISYSVYLWHWPVFVFARIANQEPLSLFVMCLLIAVTVLISWLSFRFVEVPIIRKKLIIKRSKVFIFGVSALIALSALEMLLSRPELRSSFRVTPNAHKILNAIDESAARVGVCFASKNDTGEYSGLCRIGDTSGAKPDFVLWGDSHADSFVPLFVELGWRNGKQGSVFSMADCAPIIGIQQYPLVSGCKEQNELVMRYIDDHDVKNVFLVARWSNYIMSSGKKVPLAFLDVTGSVATSSEASARSFEKNILVMARILSEKGRNVYIVKQAPEQFDYEPRKEFYRSISSQNQTELSGTKTTDNAKYQALADKSIDKLKNLNGVSVIEPAQILCTPNALCDLFRNGNLLYRDENHLSIAGVMTLEPLFDGAFKSMHP